jgi:arylsulfatase A-like enzyme
VVLDYIGYSDLPPFGAAPDVAAPNIARLSAEGRRFTQFYAAALAIGGRVIQTPLSIF